MITAQQIQDGLIVEDSHHDFKEQVDLDSDQGKVKLVDDVIAFLNVGRGNLIVGVKEERGKGRFQSWFPVPIPDNKFDDYALRVLSILKSNIDPMPLNIKVHPIEREGGTAVHIEIGEHRMQPYQNTITGGFKIRTDRNNQIIARDKIKAYFVEFAKYKADLARLMQAETEALGKRGLMAQDGPVLSIGILPREHYENHPRLVIRNGIVLTNGPMFPYHGYHRSEIFKGCPGGVEVPGLRQEDQENCRLFVSDDWFLHATVVHPFNMGGHGRLAIYEMKPLLEAYLKDVGDLLADAGVRGPFAIAFEFTDLRRNEKVAYFFQDDGPITHSPRGLLEKFDPSALAEEAFQTVHRVSRYG